MKHHSKCWSGLFVQDSCDAADDSVLDLVDYCHRKLTLLASEAIRDVSVTYDRHKQIPSIEVCGLFVSLSVWHICRRFSRLDSDGARCSFCFLKELQVQSEALEFEISLKAVSVLRYITDHSERYEMHSVLRWEADCSWQKECVFCFFAASASSIECCAHTTCLVCWSSWLTAAPGVAAEKVSAHTAYSLPPKQLQGCR